MKKSLPPTLLHPSIYSSPCVDTWILLCSGGVINALVVSRLISGSFFKLLLYPFEMLPSTCKHERCLGDCACPALACVAPGSVPAVEGDIWRPVSEHCACWSPRGPCPRPRRPQHSETGACVCAQLCASVRLSVSRMTLRVPVDLKF